MPLELFLNRRSDFGSGTNKCPICGSGVITVWHQGLSFQYQIAGHKESWKYDVLDCADCGLGYISPIPPSHILSSVYGCDYHCYGKPIGGSISPMKALVGKWRFDGFDKVQVSSLFSRINRSTAIAVEWASGSNITYTLGIPLQLTKNASILDFGYGTGGWLTAMQELAYSNLFGYDIAVNKYEDQRLTRQGITLFKGNLKCLQNSGVLFDLIRLEHVLEHLPDPVSTLSALRQLLNPNGVIVMTFPSRSNIASRKGGLRNVLLELPRHLFHYTETSAIRLLENSDFKDVSVKKIPVGQVFFRTFFPSLPKSLNNALARACNPIYSTLCRAMGDADFLSVLAKH